MKWLIRPWILAAASAALVVGAVLLVLLSPSSAQPRPAPLPVAEADREIVWLNTATSAAAWSQFVAAVRRAASRLQTDHPGVEPQVGEAAFPKQTTAVPQVALSLPGKDGRLVFRWYKLTSDWKTRDWVEALLTRRPPPLAIIGGSSSDAARELAWQLRRRSAEMPEADRPLLLLTTATADRVTDPDDPSGAQNLDLTRVYPDRTFRFCFTNMQMAAAVMRFLATQDDLRPDPNPVHMVQWDDDSYSHDLTDGFRAALPPTAGLTNPQRIDSSVGSFLTPNRFEAEVAEQVAQDLEGNRGRPLLIVTGQSAPSRRFLRELARTTPAQTRRLVVATGDALSFNTVYRDRRVAWPVQDLPFPLVFFCHFNPIDRDAGFLPEGEAVPQGESDQDRSTTGTEDVLLDSNIIESLGEALLHGGLAPNAAELSKRLLAIRHKKGLMGYEPDGTPLFGEDYNRHEKTGENVVSLRPHFSGDRVLPEATIEVWTWREGAANAAEPWVRRPEPLTVSYEPPVTEVRLDP
jgi:hypothetical protein